ncbi:hypothetical protein Gbth_005_023 [Gluconobacter thailandicus F149-1 = NBRC 100600]|jgi:hypothetical protein|uniref:Uncharacterized protein n=2 Tax=Gluconobacter thailandicus TaxID=257438 RepID=A0AAJ0QMG3_GLUTH|nr:hypothetical protein [Gluconobacter thailandicus]AFW01714.1 hypothetical protein B932_2147 [Gluconobacter oxydans H24]ANQ42671.1 hypothetical protein BAR24_15195 [Gluconobacter oxydans]GAN90697.1 hypothetical protein Gbfr_021_024 [Gluconobacter frateurii M-2]KXV33989.1 hypothetical protein AD940_08535 [Gluconobacter thailandicus]KXV52395.1 hypothetical protein AD946_13705 [Gluconobacter thailandicus]
MNGLDVGQLKHLVVEPTLGALGLGGDVAVNLLTGTALAESRGTYLKQVGGGPALGLWQMEPATHDDCWNNFLRFPVGKRLGGLLEDMLAPDLPRSAQMVTNLRYACAMARIRFYRVKEALPGASDPYVLSRYHKVHYNTVLGAADPAANVIFFKKALQA